MWDSVKADRGKIAINWTIAPSLADIAPGILNYLYGISTDKECFVTGPSGAGYIMPYNSEGDKPQDYLKDPEYAERYARMTEIYLQKSGIRVITVWDGMNETVRKAYEKHCRNLYGVTIQDWNNHKTPEVKASVENNRLRFDLLRQCYTGKYDVIHNGIADEFRKWDGKSPLFVAYQMVAWSADINTSQMVKMEAALRAAFPDIKFEFVRADHYFSYYNEFNGLPFNLCMLSSVKKTSCENYLQFDFGKDYSLNRYVLRHGLSVNCKSWKIETSVDGTTWTTVDIYRNNTSIITDIDIDPVIARYARITMLEPDGTKVDSTAEVEIYGKNITQAL